jgi:hypothetical protein
MRYSEINESADYDIKATYDRFNAAYFEGKLPNIPVGFAKLKSVGGRVTYQIRKDLYTGRKTYVPDSMKLELSSMWSRESAHLDGIMLHEMIHVYFASNGNVQENHGMRFMAMLRKISRESGIRVPVTDSVEGLELTDKNALKAVGVLLVRSRTGWSFSLMSAKNAHANSEILKTTWARRSSTDVRLYTIATPVWTKIAARVPLSRKIDSSLYLLKEQTDIDDLLTNGHLLWEIKPLTK